MPHAVLCVGSNTEGYDNIPAPREHGTGGGTATWRVALGRAVSWTACRFGRRLPSWLSWPVCLGCLGRSALAGPAVWDVTRPGPATASRARVSLRCLPPGAALRLPDGDGGAGALEGRLPLVRALLVDLLEHRLGRAVHQVLGLLEAQAGQAAHLLDYLDLLVARGLEDDVELILLLGLLGLAAAG